KSGASSWHGMHHEAQTLTTLTLPLKAAGSRPGTGLSLLTKPSRGGSGVCGTEWPIRADGINDGSPLRKPNQNSTASPAKAARGSTISSPRPAVFRGGDAERGLDVVV